MLALGEALVAQLGLEGSNDLLGRWMAHDLAERIEVARKAPVGEREERQDRCAAAILEIWRHRNCLPGGMRPFEAFEPVLDTLRALNPIAPRSFYRRAFWDGLAEQDERQGGKWLKLTRQLDQVARVLIEHMLGRATADAADTSRDWVGLAEGAGASDPELEPIRWLMNLPSVVEPRGTAAVRDLRERLAQLAAFDDIAREVRLDLEVRLAAAEAIAGAQSASHAPDPNVPFDPALRPSA